MSLFGRTIIVGAGVYLIAAVVTQWGDFMRAFSEGHLLGIVIQIINFIIFGFLFSVLSQMGFFAYLTLHRIALGMFRTYWGPIQLVLIAFAFFDLVYFRYTAFARGGEPVWPYLLLPLILLIVSLVVAEVKKRETNRHAYIPTIFFMFVITVLEWLVGLTHNDTRSIWVIGVTLMACNAYQVLKLHRLIKKD